MRSNKLLSSLVLAFTLGIAGPALAQPMDEPGAADTDADNDSNAGLWGLLGLLGGLGLLGLRRREETPAVRRTAPATGAY